MGYDRYEEHRIRLQWRKEEAAEMLLEEQQEGLLRQQTLDRFTRIEVSIARIEDTLGVLLKLLEEKIR